MGGLAWVILAAFTHWFVRYNYIDTLFSSNVYPISFVIRTIIEFIWIGFVLPHLLFKFIMVLHTMRSICHRLTKQNYLLIRPLSPDKAGGLGGLGTYSLKMVVILIPALLPLLLYIIFGELNIMLSIGIILYVPLLLFTFFYPLSSAHYAMNKFKNEELQTLAGVFNRVYDEFTKDINTKQFEDIPDDFEIMDKLSQLYEKADKMPVWPFNMETFGRFSALVATLGIPLIAQFVLNWPF